MGGKTNISLISTIVHPYHPDHDRPRYAFNTTHCAKLAHIPVLSLDFADEHKQLTPNIAFRGSESTTKTTPAQPPTTPTLTAFSLLALSFVFPILVSWGLSTLPSALQVAVRSTLMYRASASLGRAVTRTARTARSFKLATAVLFLLAVK
jgi:hypothetical protein